ncbi:MAG: glycerophosphodiester phosphodiesterase family protein [Ginsengibacter sp.]
MKLLLICLLAILFMSCEETTPKKFDLEGHRGCRGLMPENTIPAMLKAIDLNVNTLEMDVVITADDKVVVSHEPFFNHEITTLPSGDSIRESEEENYNIYKMTYDSVEKFDVGSRAYPRFPSQQKMKVEKPLLSALIDSVESYLNKTNHPKVMYNIEIKSTSTTDNIFHPEPEKFADLLMDIIEKKGIKSRVIIQSFDPRSLKIVSQKYPAMKLSLLLENQPIPLKGYGKLYGFKPNIVSPEYSLLTKGIIDTLHQRHIKVIPWTVDDLPAAKQLYDMGVDGIITDYPDRINLKTIDPGNK